MFSVFTKSSYKKLLVFSGLESMTTGLANFKEKFRVKLKKWKQLEVPFLAKFIDMKESILEEVPNFKCEIKEGAELQLSMVLDWEQSEANKNRKIRINSSWSKRKG